MRWKLILFIIFLVIVIVTFPYFYGKQFGTVNCLLLSAVCFYLAYREWKQEQIEKNRPKD